MTTSAHERKARSIERRAEEETYDLKLSFRALSLVAKSLQAAKTLGALPPQDELLDDTILVVDQALKRAV
jgi:hypothetical protein